MAAKAAVTIKIRGQEFRIRTDSDEDAMHRVASYLDDAMASVEQRTGTVDSLDLAMLTALNLAREIVELRDSGAVPGSGTLGFDSSRLQSLIELAESAL